MSDLPDRPIVLNPEAIGDPHQTPIVQLPPALAAYFWRTRCIDCQQINNTHAADCRPCGHIRLTDGCGGCDPDAIEFVRDDGGEWRKATEADKP